MPEEDVEVVRRMAQAFNQGRLKRAIDEGLIAPQIEYHDDKRWPGARSAVGTSALQERFVEVLEVLGEDGRAAVEELIDCDEGRVVMIFRFLGEGRASGIHHDYRWAFLC